MQLTRGRQPVWGAVLLVMVMIAVVFLDGALPSVAGTGEKMPWTAAGSTGLPDESDADGVKFTAEKVLFKNGADLPATAIIRYNITALTNLANFDNSSIVASLEDNGADARVLLEVVEYDVETNEAEVILTLDSDEYAGSDDPQLLSEDCGGDFDYAGHTYIVKATLEKTGSAGPPALHDLIVTSDSCA